MNAAGHRLAEEGKVALSAGDGNAEHSVLSPSSSNCWFNCTRSARLCLQFPDEDSIYASEGTEAYRLCQFLLNIALGRPDEDPRPGMKFWTQEMREYCESYVRFILERVSHYPNNATRF